MSHLKMETETESEMATEVDATVVDATVVDVDDKLDRIKQLQQEVERLNIEDFPQLINLANEEIWKSRLGVMPVPRFHDIITEKPLKLEVRVLIPVNEHPKFNFVGKLLGPRGNSLRRIQNNTGTRIAILGRGSQRDKGKEEAMRHENGDKLAHLNEELHVLIEANAPAADAYNRLAYGIAEVRKYLIPDPNDEIRQNQLQELAEISGSYMEPPPGIGRGFGGPGRGPMARGGRGGGMRGGSSGGMRGGGRGDGFAPRLEAPPSQATQPRFSPGQPGGAYSGGPYSVRPQQQQYQPQQHYAPSNSGDFNDRYDHNIGSGGFNNSGGAPAGYQSQSMDTGPEQMSGYGGGREGPKWQSWGSSSGPSRMKAPQSFAPPKGGGQRTHPYRN